MSATQGPPSDPARVIDDAPPIPDAETAALHRRLAAVWDDRPGLAGWITTVDHKRLALRYMVTAFAFFILGGLEAALMRVQLSRAESGLIGPDLYDQLFTTHGTTMMFLFAVPMVEAVGLYFVPLLVGTRNVAFPRLNAYGYWTYLFGGILLYVGLLSNTGPDAGWFAYVPLSGPEFSPGKRVDVWAQMITFTEIAGIISAVEIIATAFLHRAPGMALHRVPLFVWGMVTMSVMVLFAMPVVATDSMMLAMDRLVGTHFFNPAEGGDVLLWQHLFWFFAHPEVYIVFIPGLAMVGAILPTFTGRPVFGYTAVVTSQVAIAFLSFALWVHHMFATPIPQMGQGFFTASSVLVALPTAVALFCYLATIGLGRPRWKTPMLFVAGFVLVFTVGGLTGVILASVPVDLQITDTMFVPGHIHYVLFGGFVFPLFGAFYYWFPKITGRMLGERLGRVQFGMMITGSALAFTPMLALGLGGMPRRVYTYLPGLGWEWLNQASTAGAILLASSVGLFLVNVLLSLRRGVPAGADPWGAGTLEWATGSPPPSYNFAHLPVVTGPDPLWERTGALPVVVGMHDDRREMLITSAMDAVPDVRETSLGPTLAPLLAAVATAVTFIGGIFFPQAFLVGPALMFPALLLWAWPRGKATADAPIVEVP
jgi:cytochrome c oxidase subunit I+III